MQQFFHSSLLGFCLFRFIWVGFFVVVLFVVFFWGFGGSFFNKKIHSFEAYTA